MVISESHRFIFIAVPKTGSSSVETALESYTSKLTREFNKHATCRRLIRDLPPQMWESYFKFAFVRNPYDRIESWYFYRKRPELSDPKHPRHKMYTGDKTFEEFVHWFPKNTMMLLQVGFLAPLGELLVDHVGRFETLEEDFALICQKLNLPEIALPKIRPSQREPASDIWTPASRRIINDYFAKDFAFFDYPIIAP
ncbi:MAG: sulfotransferase family 2 domain-containing protein [Halioglobus sp.]